MSFLASLPVFGGPGFPLPSHFPFAKMCVCVCALFGAPKFMDFCLCSDDLEHQRVLLFEGFFFGKWERIVSKREGRVAHDARGAAVGNCFCLALLMWRAALSPCPHDESMLHVLEFPIRKRVPRGRKVHRGGIFAQYTHGRTQYSSASSSKAHRLFKTGRVCFLAFSSPCLYRFGRHTLRQLRTKTAGPGNDTFVRKMDTEWCVCPTWRGDLASHNA